MIKRTPQEIADIFGGYVWRTPFLGMWVICDKRPIFKGDYWVQTDDSLPEELPPFMIDRPVNSDLTKLYEPSAKTSEISSNYQKTKDSDNKPDSYYQDSPISDNKPDHLGEVYTHKEYGIVESTAIPSLCHKMAHRLENGWTPIGGLVISEPLGKDDLPIFYQAVVRGV